MKTKIAIACQGGGAQTAFTAGALQVLFEAGIDKEFEIVSLGGTSGGAVCASLIWYAFQNGEQPVWRRLLDFWTESNRPQSMQEQLFNRFAVTWSRMVGRGHMPTFEVSPYSPVAKFLFDMATVFHRETFKDFKTALKEDIDFERIREWGPLDKRPILVVGAAGVLSGKLRKFSSLHEVIQVEHILASCAVPNIFPAVKIGDDAYWDGLFADNPPIGALVRPIHVGEGNIPDEIWLIKIEPTTRAEIPTEPNDILDRRKQMEGNCALFNQIGAIMLLNDMYVWGGYTPELLEFLGWEKPIRIPKLYDDMPDKSLFYSPHGIVSRTLSKDRLGSEARSRGREHRHADGRRAKTRPRVSRGQEAPRRRRATSCLIAGLSHLRHARRQPQNGIVALLNTCEGRRHVLL
jgi:NTE family protein